MTLHGSLVWRALALVPIALLCAALTARFVGDGGDEPAESAKVAAPSASSSSAGVPEFEIAGGAVLEPLPEAPTPVATKSSRSASPQSSTPSPRSSATRSTPRPAAPPTPADAQQQCLGEGVNPLDLAALSQCIADKMGS